MTFNPPLWKASVTVPKAESSDLAALFELTPPAPQAVLISEEPFQPNAVVEALYDVEPDPAALCTITGRDVKVEALPDQDWIRSSQQGLPPVRAGRFFVYGAHDKGVVPPGVIPMCIEAGMAFGTGHHETTSLCLTALSELARKRRYTNVLDLGCGTGVLAIAAAKLWRRPVLATDIDPVAVDTARANARANSEAPLFRCGVADGFDAPILKTYAPYDLILANILAAPLTHLAPALCRALAPGGTAVLSGLLRWQENLVLSFYRANGMRLVRCLRDGPWSALLLERA